MAENKKQIREFCKNNGIWMSKYGNSYYFHLNKNKYRVSNHPMNFSQYHTVLEEEDTIDIVSNESIIDLYNSLVKGTILLICNIDVPTISGGLKTARIALDLKETSALALNALKKNEGFEIIEYRKEWKRGIAKCMI